MSPAIALARAELLALSRDRVAAFTALLVPLAAATYLVVNPPPVDEIAGPLASAAAAVTLVLFTSASVVIKSVATLVRRREQHLLERWRIAGAAPAAILGGTLAPGFLLLAMGATAMFVAIGIALDDAPTQPLWLVAAVLLAAVLGAAAATLGAAFARTSDAASIVALPIVGALLAGAMWTTLVPLAEVTWPMRATGGGALAELVSIGWDGPADGSGLVTGLTAAAPSLLVLIGLSIALGLGAMRTFRWRARG